MRLLVIEASTYVGSTCVMIDGRVAAEQEVAMRDSRSERLMPAVAEVLRGCDVQAGSLDAIVCGAGPGSFTSLRIAGSIAKGLALAAAVPLLPVSSLHLMLASTEEPLLPGRYTALMDALRDEWYSAPATVSDSGSIALGDVVLASRDAALAATGVGPGQEIEARPRARGVERILSQLPWHDPAELHSWEPRYGRLAEAQVRWESAHGRPLTHG
jgi:tRNA threonylcarbamoyladenosine biosynthesis protein TsaB